MKQICHSIIFGTALLLAAGLAACSADIDQKQQDLVPVLLTASSQVHDATQPAPGTRAANDLYTASSGFDGNEQVMVWMNSTDNSSTYTINASDHTTLQGGTLYYPAGTTGNATVFALYPAASASSHTVAHDQSADAAYKQSDLMYATLNVELASKTEAQTLSFRHQLLKLHVSVVKGEGVSTITSVKMKNVKRKVSVAAGPSSVTVGDATAADDTDGNEIILFSGSSNDPTQDYACVFPKQAWADADFIEVTADGATATYKLTRSEWTAGSCYTLTLNVSAASLGSTVSISNWSDGGNATVSSGGGDLTIADIADETYDGSAKTPTPVVKYGTTTLTLNTDYELAYRGNTNAGTAAVIAIGIGTYLGKVGVKDFTIQKAPCTVSLSTTSLQVEPNSSNTFTVTRSSDGEIIATPDNTSIATATVDQSTCTVTVTKVDAEAASTATITITVAETDNYKGYTATDKVVTVYSDTGIPFDDVTTDHHKYFIASNGKAYATKELANLFGTAVGCICYVGAVEKYFTKFIAIALEDASRGTTWSNALSNVNTYAGNHSITVGTTTYNTNAPGSAAYDDVTYNTSVSSQTRTGDVVQGWRLPSVTDWRYIFYGLNGSPSATDPVGVAMTGTYGNLHTLLNAINNACGNSALSEDEKYYWCSSQQGNYSAFTYSFRFSGFRRYYKDPQTNNADDGNGCARAVFAY